MYVRPAGEVGFKHYGIQAVWERTRWHYTVDNMLRRRDPYRFNNDCTSRYARLIMKQEPDERFLPDSN